MCFANIISKQYQKVDDAESFFFPLCFRLLNANGYVMIEW